MPTRPVRVTSLIDRDRAGSSRSASPSARPVRRLRALRSRAARELPPDRLEQRRHAFAGRGRDSVERNAALAATCVAQPFEPRRIVERVDLVRRDDHRLVSELLA